MNKTTGILVLGDQLSWQHPGLISADPAEVVEEATYVRHNRHKIALLFSAMRHFAVALRERGFQVEYYACLLYTSPSPRDRTRSRMPSSA